MPPLPRPRLAHDGDGMRLLQGQLVEVRSAGEIAASLDSDGRLDGVPFMPEMTACCGRRFRVFRRADITCVEGHGLRRMDGAVFLADVRCDGSAHDGCQRRCLIFWKEAWLKPVGGAQSPSTVSEPSPRVATGALADLPTRRQGRYVCQSTALAAATAELPRWNLLPFVSQIRSGELSVTRFVLIIALALFNLLRRFLGFRDVGGMAGQRSKSSNGQLGLQPGDWVRIRSRDEIKRTLDSNGRNRGLAFEPEMSYYCGKRFQVEFSIKNMIHEETGQMIHPVNTVSLKGLTCQGLRAKSCPRSNYWFWREQWLEGAPAPPMKA